MKTADLVVVGSAAVDVTATAQPRADTDASEALHSTTPGRVSISLGGVGRNVAEGAHRILSNPANALSPAPVLVSLIGHDMFGSLLKEQMQRIGMRTDGLISSGVQSTAVCNMVLDNQGGLVTGVADMDIIQSLSGPSVSANLPSNWCDTDALARL